MAKLDKAKQDILDAWAAKAVKGEDAKAVVDATIGAELTEQALDAAVAKAKAR